jgi:hypothetical protein
MSWGGQRRGESAFTRVFDALCAVPAQIFSDDGGHASAFARRRASADKSLRPPYAYTSFTFFSGNCRTGLPIAAWIAFITAGATTQMVGSPTPPQKS